MNYETVIFGISTKFYVYMDQFELWYVKIEIFDFLGAFHQKHHVHISKTTHPISKRTKDLRFLGPENLKFE